MRAEKAVQLGRFSRNEADMKSERQDSGSRLQLLQLGDDRLIKEEL